jgi:hypothetical protein
MGVGGMLGCMGDGDMAVSPLLSTGRKLGVGSQRGTPGPCGWEEVGRGRCLREQMTRVFCALMDREGLVLALCPEFSDNECKEEYRLTEAGSVMRL